MGTDDRLRVLQAAQGDPALLALATIDITFPELAAEEREALRRGLEAAAIPHWCNAEILRALLGIPQPDAEEVWTTLYGLTVVEPFPARGPMAGNVHEATRLAIRRRMAATDPDRLRQLSGICEEHFADVPGAHARIEHLYHAVVARPDEATALLRDADCSWVWTAHHDDRFALIVALEELVAAGALQDAANLTARLMATSHRQNATEKSVLEQLAGDLLDEAQALGDDLLVSDALVLVGDAAREQGQLPEASQAYEDALDRLGRRRTHADDGCHQRNVAIVHSRLGDVAEDRGEWRAGQDAYEQSVAILERIAAQSPDNRDLRRNLAVARSRYGDLAFAAGELDAAERAFAEGLAALEELSAAEPDNSSWKRDLAVAYFRVGMAEDHRRNLEAAATAYGKYRETMEDLVALDSSNPDWQRELASALLAVGRVAVDREDWPRAREMLDRAVTIYVALASLDPSNVRRQIDWAIALSWVGSVRVNDGDLESARATFGEAVALWKRLVQDDPTNGYLAENLENAEAQLRTVG